MTDVAAWLFLLLQVFFVDLMLGGDNAVVIALACRRLPPDDMRRAVVIGAIGAIMLRLVMILFANALLGVPLVKLIGAWTLIVIALNVAAHNRGDESDVGEGAGSTSDFLSAAAVIMFADAAMSLDNVVALAAIAGGNIWLLAIGVLLSIPILVYGAVILTRIIDRAPAIPDRGRCVSGMGRRRHGDVRPSGRGLDRGKCAGARRLCAGARRALRFIAGAGAKPASARAPIRRAAPRPAARPRAPAPRRASVRRRASSGPGPARRGFRRQPSHPKSRPGAADGRRSASSSPVSCCSRFSLASSSSSPRSWTA